MNRIIALLLGVIICAAAGFAQESRDLPVTSLASANAVLEQAALAFERGDFELAEDLYVKVAQAGFGTAQVWTNAGTSAYRADRVGNAVLYYTRALRQDPDYEPAQRSLAVAEPATNEQEGATLRAFLRQTSPLLWVALAQALLLVVCIALAKFLSAPDRDTRGYWLAVFGWTAAFTVVFGLLAGASHQARLGTGEAVVITEGAVARSAPTAQSVEELLLPAGTIVEMTEEPRGGFVRFRMADGNSGFLSIDDLERI